MHPYLLEGFFLSFQLILEILCSVPQSNLIGCILTWRILGTFCILDLLRKFLQFGILAILSCHHDALSGQRNTCRYVPSQQLQIPAPFHRSAKCSAGRERDALPSRPDQEIYLDSKNGKSWRTVPGSVYCVFRLRKLVVHWQFANKLKISTNTSIVRTLCTAT